MEAGAASKPALQRTVMLPAQHQQPRPTLARHFLQNDRRWTEEDAEVFQLAIPERRGLQRAIDGLARHGELQILHLDHLRVGIDGHQGRPCIPHRMDQLAPHTCQLGDTFTQIGGSYGRRRGVYPNHNRSPAHRALPREYASKVSPPS